ncbi:trypsin-like peptidase domain-containing protein [Salinicola sp. CPA57]|uniref:trypsin-like peptidase domain-containing protein n=1 Tax=Salinicola sp. CPA57 TaxID=1949080 RepID=UPI000DA14257|nr:trypsin-like peptidase domain-containing protein [Salinicola sp. CPA57]
MPAHVLDQMMNSTVRIESRAENGSIATGTGFLYAFHHDRNTGNLVPGIITNKHVVEEAQQISFPVNVKRQGSEDPIGFENVTLQHGSLTIVNHPSDNVDLCAILAAPIFHHFEVNGFEVGLSFISKDNIANKAFFDYLLPLEELTMIGYPNGIWDSYNNGAIARRGSIATTPAHDYLGKSQFVMDMACFPGSSGSPVFLTNLSGYMDRNNNTFMGGRIKLLGVLYAGPQHMANGSIEVELIPTHNKPVSKTSIPNNLGYVIKSTEIDVLEQQIPPC